MEEKRRLSLPVFLGERERCQRCADWMADALSKVPGVESVAVDVEKSTLEISYYPDLVSFETLERKAHDVGAELSRRFRVDTLSIVGLDCPDCALKVDKLVSALDGVHSASLNFATGNLRVEYEADKVSQPQLVALVESLGYGVSRTAEQLGLTTSVFRLSGLDCPECALKVERRVGLVPGVRKVTASAATQLMVVEHEPASAVIDETIKAVSETGYGATLEQASTERAEAPSWWRNARVVLTMLSGVAFALGLLNTLLGGQPPISVVFYLLAIAAGGYYIFRGGLYSLRALSADMNLLMSLAVIGALFIGEFTEAAAIVFLFSVANTLESFSLGRTRDAIRSLIALSPREATVLRQGREVRVKVEDLRLGDVIVVRPGERLPMDGRVVAGASSVNQAPITGESTPVEKNVGDEVFAGTINGRGALEVRIDHVASDTTLARIINLVEEAQTQKAAAQQFVDRFSRYYTPAVIAIAAAVVIVPSLILGQPFTTWFYRGLVLLVIACPCALVISTPVSIVSAIGTAARKGSLVKGGVFLEEVGTVAAVAFDKTGTLTVGRPTVTDVIPLDGMSPREVLTLAASVEVRSEHPLASAVVDEARHQNIDLLPIKTFQSFAGRGASAALDGQTYYVGSPRLFRDLAQSTEAAESAIARLQAEGKSAILVGTRERLVGIVAVADSLRPNARETINTLHRLGIQRVAMLTGDNAEAANAIAAQLGIDDYRAELLPEDKVEAVRGLTQRYRRVAMVGDGVNDAPALAASNVGIAMGVAGSDVALETADIALMSDDLSRVPYTIGLGRATNTIIRQNIIFALVIKALFLALTVPGLTTLWLAVVADMGASLLVIANGLRLLGYRGPTAT